MDNCCLNILTEYDGVKYNIAMILNSESGQYHFTLYDSTSESIYVDVIMYYSEGAGSWYIANESNPSIVYYYFDSEYVCPSNSIYFKVGDTNWIAQEELPINIGDFDNFVMYPIPCEEESVTPPAPVVEECIQLPCRNTNLIKKQKASLSTDIAKVSKQDMYGFDCQEAWDNIFMRTLIIDVVNCMPYDFFTQDEERCLIGKLTDKCNC